MRTCTHPSCDQKHYGKGYCQAHYKRIRKGADMDAPLRETTLSGRFWAKVEKSPGCWRWTGAPTAQGYGSISREGRPTGAHRVSYEMHRGPIPDGMQIDHACRNRLCVNPDHLRVVTDGENKQNVIANRTNSTGLRGVTYHPKRRKWMAKATKAGKHHYLGWHESAEAAYAAVSEWRRRHMPFSEIDKMEI